jgi:amidase
VLFRSLLKDLIASYGGTLRTAGSALLRDYIDEKDSHLVVRLKDAGLVVMGKTNTPEFGALPTAEPLLFGPCRNPWNLTRTTGGSSGGSAAAVAAGLVPMAHANDGGGSIRIPASCCALFGLKPTRGRNPLGPEIAQGWGGLVVEHAVTRSVRDSAGLLDATSGPGLGDPYWAAPNPRPFSEEVQTDPGRLRIAFTTAAPTGVEVHPDCVEAVAEAAALCTHLGHDVQEASPELDGKLFSRSYFTVFIVGIASEIDFLASRTGRAPTSDQFEPMTWALYQKGKEHSGVSYVTALETLHRIARGVAGFFRQYDLLLTPTLAEPPVPLGTFDSPPEDPMAGMKRVARFMAFTQLCNVTGQPAMSVPLHWNADGLPVGVHFMARFGEESTLLRLAAQLEAERPWMVRRPPVFA